MTCKSESSNQIKNGSGDHQQGSPGPGKRHGERAFSGFLLTPAHVLLAEGTDGKVFAVANGLWPGKRVDFGQRGQAPGFLRGHARFFHLIPENEAAYPSEAVFDTRS